jgi:tetratricopeptide (TPR) repeat protein
MQKRNLSLAMAAIVLLADLALGQTRDSGVVERRLPDSRLQAEDVEVMRRLLKDTLQRTLHARAGSVPLVVSREGELYNIANPPTDWNTPALSWIQNQNPWIPNQNDSLFNAQPQQAPQQSPANGDCWIEGSHLNGYGVVYGIQLPVHFIDRGKRGAAPASKPMSQWDRIQKELRGENVPVEPKGNQSEPETIVDTILKTIAENGQHLSELLQAVPKTPTAANERLTVVVTVRQGQRCEVCHSGHAAAGQAPREEHTLLLDHGADGRRTIYSNLANAWVAQQPGTASVSPNSSPRGDKEANDQVLLGDLHVKQGRYKEAVSAYKAALEKNHGPGEQLNMTELALAALAQNQGAGGQLNSDLARVEIASKLAQAQNAAGDQKGALDTVAKVRELSQLAEIKARENRAGSTSARFTRELGYKEQSAAGELPSKLTITVAKSDLDAFHAGEIDLERFKKAATVDIQVFLPKATPAQAPGPDASGPKNAAEPKP